MLKKIFSALIALFLTFFSPLSQANVLGDFQTFVPNTDGLFFITVDSGQTLKKHTVVGNAYLSYTKDYLYVNDNITSQNRQNYKDHGLFLDGTIGVSLTDSLQVFTGVTQLVDYKSESSNGSQYTLTQGVHSFRPGLKYKILSTRESQLALLASVDILNVQNDPYTGEDPSSIINISAAYSTRFGGNATHGFNIGYRERKPGSTSADATFYPLKSQLTYSYGYSKPVTSKTRFVFETIGCLPIDKGGNKNEADLQCLELLGAARYRYDKNWAFVGGGTFEPLTNRLGPSYRAFIGMNVYLYPNAETQELQQAQEVDPLVVPDILITYPKKSLSIPIRGGKPDYTCSLKESSPEASLVDCIFTSPLNKDSALVEVSDTFGQTQLTQILVKSKTQPVSQPHPKKVVIEKDVTPKGLPIYDDVRPVKETRITLSNLNFVFDTTQLVSVSRAHLNEAIDKLKKLKIRSITVEGHTDNLGSEEYNQILSEERAQAIAEILSEELKLNINKFTVIGHGFSQPLNDNTDEESRLENRRVELSVFYYEE